jgi:heme/copper-type cytochrome/quinol oxidase subunit 2
LQIRTVAAIIAWFVVSLLLINRVYRSEWILPIAIALTVIAVLVYFSPRLRKKPKTDTKEAESA